MRRTQQTSPLEDVTDFAARFHWSVGLAGAAISFLVLHHLAAPAPVVTPVTAAQVVSQIVPTMIRMASSVLQYLVPLPFLAGALLSWIRRRRVDRLHDRVAADTDLDALEKMSWREFEALVGEVFRRKGYRVVERGGDGPDGGVDLEAYLERDKYLIQCKQWKTRLVGVAVVRELFGVMTAEQAVGGFVVAAGDFTPDAKAFAQGRGIELLDSRELRRQIGGFVPPASRSTANTPPCPKCNGPMVRRTAKSGPNAGSPFWGCTTYPKCRGMRDL